MRALAAIFGASITPAAGNRAAQAPNRPGNPAVAVETSLRYDVPGHPTPRTQTIPAIHQTGNRTAEFAPKQTPAPLNSPPAQTRPLTRWTAYALGRRSAGA